MNKKGFTLIELITTFALASVIIIILINIIVVIRDLYLKTNIKGELVIEQSNLSNLMNKKFEKDMLDEYNPCDESDFCYSFSFVDGSTSKLVVDDNYIKFDNYVYKIKKGTTIDNPSLQIDEIMATTDEEKLFLSIKIPIKHRFYKDENFGIDIVYQNYGQTDSNIPEAKSFREDSWDTIAKNVRAGNLSKYKVGDTKEIALTGFTNGEEGSNGLYTIRIANTSTPEECKEEGFSQTACGFVIEFEDIITTHVMNSTDTNVGGWEASEMRSYVNSDILNSFPEELKSNIIDTIVVSGHGSTSGEKNFTTTDKLYLLSTAEVWEQGTSNTIEYDTARDVTRQLDYYKSIGATTDNYSGAMKKYNGIADYWWLRSAYSYFTNYFYIVSENGDWINNSADYAYVVAVAFRL